MNNYNKLVLFAILTIILINIYGYTLFYLKISPNDDPLKYNFFDNSMDLNGWSVTHFIVFTLAGYYYPNEVMFSLIIGISWEIIEECYVFLNNKLTDNYIDWWRGKYSDIIVNFLGLMTGKYIIRKYI
tara:strand:+ start:2650 stop:3033 length:384 start_codon:yes stop_codon:yes gene_type:complete